MDGVRRGGYHGLSREGHRKYQEEHVEEQAIVSSILTRLDQTLDKLNSVRYYNRKRCGVFWMPSSRSLSSI